MSSSIRVVDCFGLAPVEQLKSLVGFHQTDHSGVLLGARMCRGQHLKQYNYRGKVRERKVIELINS